MGVPGCTKLTLRFSAANFVMFGVGTFFIKKAFISACEDAGIEGLVWRDLRATYGTRLGEAGFNPYDIAKLMGHANISTSQRYVRNLPVGTGEAVMLKNQRRHDTVTSEDSL